MNSSGKWYDQPALNNRGTPFWNKVSGDAPSTSSNVRFCIYGGGACNGGVALAPGAKFLASATSPSLSATDVTFSVNGRVDTKVSLESSSHYSILGYYLASNPNVFKSFGTSDTVGQTYTFTPGGDFGIYGVDIKTWTGYNSQSFTGYADPTLSHFAFFTPAPEPGMTGLVGGGLLAVGAYFRRKKAGQN